LSALSALREILTERIPSLRLLLSPAKTVDAARDKRKSKELFASLGAEVPQDAPANPAPSDFPLFVKPPDGSSSLGAESVADAAELAAALKKNPALMVERVVGGPEYTVDVLCDFDGAPLCAVPRKRIKVRGGEVVQGVVEMRSDLIELSKRLASGFGARGPATLQFRMPEEGRFVAMELNARMGGGLPLAVAAGADWPGMILDLAAGRRPDLRFSVKDGLAISRYDASAFFMPGDLSAARPATPRLAERPELLKGVKAYVFDLDDTIYLERDFVFSGYRAVAEFVWRELGVEIECSLRGLFASGRRGDLFTEALKMAGIEPDPSFVMTLVEIYRGHPPRIAPCVDFDCVRKLRAGGPKTGLLSDGWRKVQASKVEALGIGSDFDSIILTDALGGPDFWKPSPKPFKRVLLELDVKPEEAVYIGDNPDKDFIGARALGMKTLRICRRGGERFGCAPKTPAHAPDATIESFKELV
jgi:FMN phosphatase YigB (HAD superfamily)